MTHVLAKSGASIAAPAAPVIRLKLSPLRLKLSPVRLESGFIRLESGFIRLKVQLMTTAGILPRPSSTVVNQETLN